jgi:hypothetical protein
MAEQMNVKRAIVIAKGEHVDNYTTIPLTINIYFCTQMSQIL